MKMRLALTAFCLFCIGIFSQAQDSKKAPAKTKPTVENGPDAIPVTVTSTKKKKKAPEAEVVKFTPPVIVKDGDKKAPPPPPPPPAPKKDNTPITPIPPLPNQED